MTMYDEDLIEFLGEDKNNYNSAKMQFEFTNVACGIRIPGVEKMKLENPVSKIDIKPTISNFLGLKDEFSLGKNIFDGKPYVVINNGKIITTDYLYDGSNWLKLEDGTKVELDTLDEETKNMLKEYLDWGIKELGISNSIVVENLLKDKIN